MVDTKAREALELALKVLDDEKAEDGKLAETYWSTGSGGQAIAAIENVLAADDLGAMLERYNRNRLHSHACESCGDLRCACNQLPCEFRPFDRNASGEWYVCGFCKMAERVVREMAEEERA